MTTLNAKGLRRFFPGNISSISLLPRNIVYDFVKDKKWRHKYPRKWWCLITRHFHTILKRFEVKQTTNHLALVYTKKSKLVEIRKTSNSDETYFLQAMVIATILVEKYIEYDDQIIIKNFDFRLPFNKIKFADKAERLIAKIAYELIMPEIEFRKIYFESVMPYPALEEFFRVGREMVISRAESLNIKDIDKDILGRIKCMTLESTTYEEFVEYIMYKLGIANNIRNNPKVLKELFHIYECKFNQDSLFDELF